MQYDRDRRAGGDAPDIWEPDGLGESESPGADPGNIGRPDSGSAGFGGPGGYREEKGGGIFSGDEAEAGTWDRVAGPAEAIDPWRKLG